LRRNPSSPRESGKITLFASLVLRKGWPALVTLAVHLLIIGFVLAGKNWDPLELVRTGTRYSSSDPDGSAGYDGQFSYYIALDPIPESVAPRLDVPAYRYQRILYPVVARLIAAGNELAVPWTLPLVNLAAHFVGTWLVAELLAVRGAWRGYALVYGLWAGFAYSVRLDLSEPLAYALVAAAIWAVGRGKERPGAVLFGLALFTKETTVLFLGAQCVSYLLRRRSRSLLELLAIALLPFLAFQGFLYIQFGGFGLASGGELATPFEFIPYGGFWQIASFGLAVFLLFAVIFVPSIILPSIWGTLASVRRLIGRDFHPDTLTLFANATLLAFVPFSTYREPVGITRFACGLVLATLLFGAHTRSKRTLNYAVFWIPMTLMLANG